MKLLIVKLDEGLLKEAKIKAITEDKPMKQYLTELIKKDLETKKRTNTLTLPSRCLLINRNR